jgi:L-rhamnose mutarotase
MPHLYYALDLQDDPGLISEYERWHQCDRIWPGVVRSLHASGILDAGIFRTGNRLVLILEVGDDFDPARKAEADAADPVVAKWEALMWTFQKALPWARPGEKWVSMRRIFSLRAVSEELRGAGGG